MIKKIIESITNYLKFIENTYGYEITMHDLRSYIHLRFCELLPYNFHRNPYCMLIKSSEHVALRCQKQQEKAMAKFTDQIDDEPFCGVCPAGVREFVFPLRTIDGQCTGIVCVTGHKSEQGKQRLHSYAEQYGYDETDLRHAYAQLHGELPDKAFVQTLIAPFLSMYSLLHYHVSILSERDAADGGGSVPFAQILSYIQNHYRVKLTLAEIARIHHCSVSSLSHMFYKKCDYHFNEYLNMLRMEVAKQLLRYEKFSIQEVAFYVGFLEPNYFYTVFRKHIGVSPSAWRKKHA